MICASINKLLSLWLVECDVAMSVYMHVQLNPSYTAVSTLCSTYGIDSVNTQINIPHFPDITSSMFDTLDKHQMRNAQLISVRKIFKKKNNCNTLLFGSMSFTCSTLNIDSCACIDVAHSLES